MASPEFKANSTAVTLQVSFALRGIAEALIFSIGIVNNSLTFIILWRVTMGLTCKTLTTALCMSDFFACVFGLGHAVLYYLLIDREETKPG